MLFDVMINTDLKGNISPPKRLCFDKPGYCGLFICFHALHLINNCDASRPRIKAAYMSSLNAKNCSPNGSVIFVTLWNTSSFFCKWTLIYMIIDCSVCSLLKFLPICKVWSSIESSNCSKILQLNGYTTVKVRLIHLLETLFQIGDGLSIGPKRHATFLPEASYGLRVLSLPACVCACVCPSITSLSAQ